jgi:hypothetical protein
VADNENSLTALKKFFSTEDRPVSNLEFTEFWKSLSEEEKDEFRKAELK